MSSETPNRYRAILDKIFFDRYSLGATDVPFSRSDLRSAAEELDIERPKNLGDIIYSGRYRAGLSARIKGTTPPEMEWIIEGTGRAAYAFRLVRINRIVPNRELVSVKIPDSTPEIVAAYALSDEQALLAKIRYSRLIDVFLGVASFSLQNHLRTTVQGVGQIEIDEIYVAVDHRGRQYVIPVQAKGGSDALSAVQTKQDLMWCAERFPHLICRSVSTQFMADDLIALFELTLDGDQVQVVSEKHYRLVPSEQITQDDLDRYSALP